MTTSQDNTGYVVFADRVVPAKEVDYRLHWDCVRVERHDDAVKIRDHTCDVAERKRIATEIYAGGTFSSAAAAGET